MAGPGAKFETLVFAVGEANGLEARFAARLATVLKNNSSRLQLKIVPNGDNAKALAQFDRREANLAILRTDGKIPPRARTVAILDHDVMLLLSPGGKEIKTIADLKKKKIAVLAESESSVTFVRTILELSETPEAATRVQMAPPGRPRQAVRVRSRCRGRDRPCLADHAGQELRAIGQARRLYPERDPLATGVGPEIPAISEETVATVVCRKLGLGDQEPFQPDGLRFRSLGIAARRTTCRLRPSLRRWPGIFGPSPSPNRSRSG